MTKNNLDIEIIEFIGLVDYNIYVNIEYRRDYELATNSRSFWKRKERIHIKSSKKRNYSG